MMALITKLCENIPENGIRLNHPVCKIEKKFAGALVSVGELEKEPWTRFSTNKVILALPPRLAAATILFNPDLSHNFTQAMLKIGTWMAGQAKFCALYKEPFWRKTGLSGQAFSQIGPLGEIHDGSNNGQGPYGLTGFVGIPAVQRNHQQLLTEAILSQLAIIYGKPCNHLRQTGGTAGDLLLPGLGSRTIYRHPVRPAADVRTPPLSTPGRSNLHLGRYHPFCRHGNDQPTRRLSRRCPDRRRTGGNKPLMEIE
jgi:hypothetical protein